MWPDKAMVILNGAERSEESKIVAQAQISDYSLRSE